MKKDNSMDNTCILKLYKLFFSNIEFRRYGAKNQDELKLSLECMVMQHSTQDLYKVDLICKGEKESEYSFSITISGLFNVSDDDDIDEDLKKELLTTNSVAILMPYLRSEITLLTSQPEVDSVVLPPLNIKALFENAEKND